MKLTLHKNLGYPIAVAMVLLGSSVKAGGPQFTPEPLPPLAGTPTANIWDGPYVGVGVGATTGDFTFDYAYDSSKRAETGNHDLNATTYGGFIGYGRVFGKSYIAVELGGDFYGASDEQDYHTKCALGASGLEYTLTATLRAGYLLTPELLAYVHGGAAWAQASASVGWQLPYPQQSVDSMLTGYVYGAGLEYAISEHGRVRLEYAQYDFDSLETGKYIGANHRADFDHSNVQVQLAWQF